MTESIKFFYKDRGVWQEINRLGLQCHTPTGLDMPNRPPTNLIRMIDKASQPHYGGRISTPICNHNAPTREYQDKTYCTQCYSQVEGKPNDDNTSNTSRDNDSPGNPRTNTDSI